MSLRHIPTRRMVSGSIFLMSREMSLPARRQHALMLASVKPMDRTAARTMERIAVVIFYPLIWCNLLACRTLDIGVSPVLLWHQMHDTRRLMADTGYP